MDQGTLKNLDELGTDILLPFARYGQLVLGATSPTYNLKPTRDNTYDLVQFRSTQNKNSHIFCSFFYLKNNCIHINS